MLEEHFCCISCSLGSTKPTSWSFFSSGSRSITSFAWAGRLLHALDATILLKPCLLFGLLAVGCGLRVIFGLVGLDVLLLLLVLLLNILLSRCCLSCGILFALFSFLLLSFIRLLGSRLFFPFPFASARKDENTECWLYYIPIS